MRINNVISYNYNPQQNSRFGAITRSSKIAVKKYIKHNPLLDIKNSQIKYNSAYKYDIEKFFAKHIPALNKSNFTKNDYENLTSTERKIFRKIIKKHEKIKNDSKLVFKVAEKLKKYLDEKYPDGYKIISIGNSAAPFIESMDLMGASAITIPFSKAMINGNNFPYKGSFGKPYTKKDWEKYFIHHGISQANSNKKNEKLIFTDFKYLGTTIDIFKNIIDNLGFNNAEVISFHKLLNNTSLSKEKIRFVMDSMHDQTLKYLSRKPSPKYLNFNNKDVIRHPNVIDSCGEGFASKLLKFLYYDKENYKNSSLLNKIMIKLGLKA